MMTESKGVSNHTDVKCVVDTVVVLSFRVAWPSKQSSDEVMEFTSLYFGTILPTTTFNFLRLCFLVSQ